MIIMLLIMLVLYVAGYRPKPNVNVWLILSLIYNEKIMSNMTRKEFLKLTGTAAGAGLTHSRNSLNDAAVEVMEAGKI